MKNSIVVKPQLQLNSLNNTACRVGSQNKNQSSLLIEERSKEHKQRTLDIDCIGEDKSENMNSGKRYNSPSNFTLQKNLNNLSPRYPQNKTQLRKISEQIFGQKTLYEEKPIKSLKKLIQSPANQWKHNFQFDDIYKDRIQSPSRHRYKNQDQIALVDTNLNLLTQKDLSPRGWKWRTHHNRMQSSQIFIQMNKNLYQGKFRHRERNNGKVKFFLLTQQKMNQDKNQISQVLQRSLTRTLVEKYFLPSLRQRIYDKPFYLIDSNQVTRQIFETSQTYKKSSYQKENIRLLNRLTNFRNFPSFNLSDEMPNLTQVRKQIIKMPQSYINNAKLQLANQQYTQRCNRVNGRSIAQSKLKGLENKPNFPVEQPPKYDKKDANSTNVDYNILSNKKFREHHFLSPELRPISKKEQQKVQKMTTTGLRNYNIITNRYLENNEQKILWDDYIQKQESALKYWNSHDYNPILAQFYQKDKEEEFQQKRVEEAKKHGNDQIERLPDGIKYSESALFQPINGIVVDEKKLYNIDMKKKMAKQRYEARYDLEQEYHLRDIEEQERQANRSLNKQFHNKYVQDRERGYNILTNANFVGKNAQKLWDPYTKPTPTVWDQIIAYRQTKSAFPSIQQQQNNSIFNRQFSQTSNDQQAFKENLIQGNQSNRGICQSLQPPNLKIHQIVQQQNEMHQMTPSPSIKYINQGKQMIIPQSRNMKIQEPNQRSSLQDFNRKEFIQTPVDNKRIAIPAIKQRNIRTSGILK